MAGDLEDFARRLREQLPSQWFGDENPVLDSVLAGMAEPLAHEHALAVYADAQTRLLSATHGWLDLWASDFFGDSLQRRPNQTDTSYRARIVAALFRERGTRAAMERVLTDLTGSRPVIFEPSRPADTGAWRLAGGYGAAGGWGSLSLPRQSFVRVAKPPGSGIPRISGYGQPAGGYGQPSRAAYASIEQITDAVTDADIYDAIERTKPAGSIVWTAIGA